MSRGAIQYAGGDESPGRIYPFAKYNNRKDRVQVHVGLDGPAACWLFLYPSSIFNAIPVRNHGSCLAGNLIRYGYIRSHPAANRY